MIVCLSLFVLLMTATLASLPESLPVSLLLPWNDSSTEQLLGERKDQRGAPFTIPECPETWLPAMLPAWLPDIMLGAWLPATLPAWLPASEPGVRGSDDSSTSFDKGSGAERRSFLACNVSGVGLHSTRGMEVGGHVLGAMVAVNGSFLHSLGSLYSRGASAVG